MNNPKTAIQEIKNLMVKFGFMDEKPALQSFKLEDDTILQAEKLEVGKKITKINENFELADLEDGTYHIDNFEVNVVNSTIDAVKEVFLDAKLIDGTIVKVEGEELVAGAAVKVVTEQGEIPAPDGIHELEDGTKVQTVDGVITEIKKKEEPQVEVEVEMENKVDDNQEMYELMKKLMEKMSQKMGSMEEKLSQLENNFNAFKKEPAGKKVSDGKTEFTSVKENNSRLDAIMALRNKK